MDKFQLYRKPFKPDVAIYLTSIPIAVKSGSSVMCKSLTSYHKEFQPKIRIRYSLKDLKWDDGLLNIPLFMVDYTKKMIGKVKE